MKWHEITWKIYEYTQRFCCSENDPFCWFLVSSTKRKNNKVKVHSKQTHVKWQNFFIPTIKSNEIFAFWRNIAEIRKPTYQIECYRCWTFVHTLTHSENWLHNIIDVLYTMFTVMILL